MFPGDWRADLLCMFCMHASTYIYRWITILYRKCSQVSTVLILKVLSFSVNVRWRGIKLSSPRHIFLPNVYMMTHWVLGPHPSSNSPLILIFKFSDSILHGCETQVDKQIDRWQSTQSCFFCRSSYYTTCLQNPIFMTTETYRQPQIHKVNIISAALWL